MSRSGVGGHEIIVEIAVEGALRTEVIPHPRGMLVGGILEGFQIPQPIDDHKHVCRLIGLKGGRETH
jgi:hypothetical protein